MTVYINSACFISFTSKKNRRFVLFIKFFLQKCKYSEIKNLFTTFFWYSFYVKCKLYIVRIHQLNDVNYIQQTIFLLHIPKVSYSILYLGSQNLSYSSNS